MCFKIDENLPVDVTGLLGGQGHEAHAVHDEGLTGSSDIVLAATCRRERRALITLDVGFGDLRRYPPGEHHGPILLRLRDTSTPSVLNPAGPDGGGTFRLSRSRTKSNRRSSVSGTLSMSCEHELVD